MKRFLLTLLLACAPAMLAHAAPAQPATSPAPTEAQIQALFEAMDMETTLQAMSVQMGHSIREMIHGTYGADMDEEQLALLETMLDKQLALMREWMSWDKLEPIYRRIYMQAFTAAEIEAMTGFYASEHGSSAMRKMPQVLALTMREMQPMLKQLMEQTRQSIEEQLKKHEAGTEATAPVDK